MTPQEPLDVRVLGTFAVERGGAPLELPPSRKTRALLAYLAVTGRPHNRARLCELLWNIPDDPRGALRWSLSKLRPLVDDADRRRIVTDGEHVAFDCGEARIDLADVRAAVANGVDGLPTHRLRALAASFRGDFLDGLDLAECPEFQAWCVAERDEARALRASILAALVGRLSTSPDDALPYARAHVELDPLFEPARASLVRLLRRSGRHAEAERHVDEGTRLFRELGTQSSGELLAAWQEFSRRGAAPGGVPAAPAESEPAGPERPRRESHMQQEIRFCTVSDGVRIAYATVGDGPPLVKAANWMNHLEYDWESPVWRHLMEALARDHYLVRYDERGNGLSEWQVEDISFEAFVRDLETVVDATGLDRFALLGISQGSAVSIAYAVRHPERVSHLILHGGYPLGWRNRGSQDEIDKREALVTLMRQGWGQENPAFRQIFTSLYVPDASVEQIRWFNELQRISASPENAIRLQYAFGAIDVTELLSQVAVPTLITHSRGDAVAPFEQGRRLAMSIPGARFASLDSNNHLILEQEPAWPKFMAEVRSFLGTG